MRRWGAGVSGLGHEGPVGGTDGILMHMLMHMHAEDARGKRYSRRSLGFPVAPLVAPAPPAPLRSRTGLQCMQVPRSPEADMGIRRGSDGMGRGRHQEGIDTFKRERAGAVGIMHPAHSKGTS
jgi:hypothetical protein